MRHRLRTFEGRLRHGATSSRSTRWIRSIIRGIRGISVAELEEAISNRSEVIEDYPEDKYRTKLPDPGIHSQWSSAACAVQLLNPTVGKDRNRPLFAGQNLAAVPMMRIMVRFHEDRRRCRAPRRNEDAMAKTLFEKIWDATSSSDMPDGTDAALYRPPPGPRSDQSAGVSKGCGCRPHGAPAGLTFATMDHNVPTDDRSIIVDPISKAQIEALEQNCAEFGVTLYGLDERPAGHRAHHRPRAGHHPARH